jgi:orotate phosphoribosyltransferase
MVAPSPGTLRQLLLDSGAVRFGHFVLTSGQESDVYVDIKQVWTRPERLRVLASALAARVGDEAVLAGMELGAVPLVVATALETGRPYVVVRKAGRAHGTGRRFEGELPAGGRVLVLEDVTTTGGSLVETVEVLRAAGAIVTRAVTVVDREQGGVERLRAAGVELLCLETLSGLRGAPR